MPSYQANNTLDGTTSRLRKARAFALHPSITTSESRTWNEGGHPQFMKGQGARRAHAMKKHDRWQQARTMLAGWILSNNSARSQIFTKRSTRL